MKRKYPGSGHGAITSVYLAIDNMAWLRERQKCGHSISETVNRAILLVRNLETASVGADAAAIHDETEVERIEELEAEDHGCH